jgi:prevent-host-death family protein
MGQVGVKVLKNRLTEYLRRVKDGDEVIVTERGRPVAVIQPLRGEVHLESPEARLARLAARGAITLPTQPPLSRVRRVRVRGRPISAEILESRR